MGSISRRNVVVGRNSKVWKALIASGYLDAENFVALSHTELDRFSYQKEDRVWILSYSREPVENMALLSKIHSAGIAELYYVTSASTVIAEKTSCYRYPRVKEQCQRFARDVCGAKILSIGLVYSVPGELPSGVNAATQIEVLAEFISAPYWADDGQTLLFDLVDVEFKSRLEEAVFKIYGLCHTLCGSYPCVLRPIDYILRAMNFRWYGYLYLSNKIWCTKI